MVKGSKEGRAIILTTHSMQEAEILCDRLGIFVNGQLMCIGTPKEITTRFASEWSYSVARFSYTAC
jgi:ABC-type multidrug transport system ATPase subunit